MNLSFFFFLRESFFLFFVFLVKCKVMVKLAREKKRWGQKDIYLSRRMLLNASLSTAFLIIRSRPHTICTFVFMEQVKALFVKFDLL